jgi:sugar phosphate isomerase/epimerase
LADKDLRSPMKISICNELFQGWPIEEVIAYVARLGYDGVEIAPYTLADSVADLTPKRRRQIKEAAEKCGIEIVGLHWLLVKPEGLHINHPDEFIRIKTQEYIEALIHFCADIGGKLLLHGSPHQRTVHEDWDYEKCWGFAEETFKVCLKVASRRNVIYCIEPLLRVSTNFINTVDDALRFVREMNHPQFQMMFDCRNACAEEKTAATALVRALTSGHLRHIHVNDANGSGPGCGDTKFLPMLKILLENNYRGYLSVEVSQFDPDPRTVASQSIGYLKGLLEPFLHHA